MRGVILGSMLTAAGMVSAAAAPVDSVDTTRAPGVWRVATFNASLNRATEGGLRRSVSTPDDPQIRNVAEIIQRVRPDVLLLQEFDYDVAGESLRGFQSNYLARAQQGAAPIHFAYSFCAESNTGIPSGFDLDRDGRVGGGGDALGFGEFPGQYGMVVLSQVPIDTAGVRTFRKFRWRDMPGARLPDDAATPAPMDWYSPEELAVLPLSSKSHWDLPLRLGGLTLHLLVSHPTPPAFDGPEDRNGLRNHDEIRFWTDYLSGARYVVDDQGRRGGLRHGAGRTGKFIVMGDQNSDPIDGGSLHEAIEALLEHPRVDARFVPRSPGALSAALLQGAANATQRADPATDTADFNDTVAGNLRVDYLLPSKGLAVCGGGVFWPAGGDPAARLVWGDAPPPSSDHRLVWLDVSAGAARCPPGNGPTASAAARPRR